MASQTWPAADAVSTDDDAHAAHTAVSASGEALLRALEEHPEAFDFFQAVRRLECALRGHARLGEGLRAADEAVRLGQEPTLAFAPATVAAFQRARGAARPRLTTTFMGAFGAHGPLPHHLTEYARQRLRNNGDATLSRFLDLFHHRILSLYYRAFANGEPTVNRDRPETDRFADFVGALIGRGMPSMRRRDAFPDCAKLYYAGRLATTTANAEGLAAIVGDFFRVPAAVQQWMPEWIEVPEPTRWHLGLGASSRRLGRSSVLGRRAPQCQGKFRVVLGPLCRADYERFLPGEPALERLAALVRNYVGDTLAWDVRLLLQQSSRHSYRLGNTSRLGRSAWLGRCPNGEHQEALVLNPQRSTTAAAASPRQAA